MELRNAKGQTLQEFLADYDENRYRRPSNTVDMVLMTVHEGQLKLLLIRRKDHPFIGQWALPGGFINFDEDMETAVQRELEEETSIHENTYFHQLYTFGNADRDPRTRIITTVYLSMTPETNIRKTFANDDAADAAWFTIRKCVQEQNDRERVSVLTLQYLDTHMEYCITDTVKNNYIETRSQLMEESTTELASDHVKAVNMAMDQVMNRAASTGILFNLLEEEFTLREVQNVYEAIIAKKTDTGNFRRDIKRMLKETGTYKNVKGKKVKLYRFDPMYRYLEENL
ncbi:MAG: NUDIX hydrolase [Solobacterium sp.]|nr:NUDIX hydrolase [Solobacterium sp.]